MKYSYLQWKSHISQEYYTFLLTTKALIMDLLIIEKKEKIGYS